jgi:hypothetical protein
MRFQRFLYPLLLVCLSQAANAQTVDSFYSGTYSITNLGSITGLPTKYGGLIFKDANTIWIGGAANGVSGLFYSVTVTRGAGNHVVSLGTATALGFGTYNDGGIAFDTGGVLFYTEYPVNNMGEVLPPGYASDYKTVGLTALGITSSVGAANFVPADHNGAGQFKVVSFEGNGFYTVPLTSDGSGGFNLGSATLETTLNTCSSTCGPEGFIYVPLGSSLFSSQSMLVSEYGSGSVGSYPIDANGNPIPASRHTFISGLTGVVGAAIDPLTGDFFFSTFGVSNQVYEVRGFVPPTVPPTIVKSFGAGSIPLNGSTSFSFTISNPNVGSGLTGVGFTDTFPAGLVISTPNGLTGSCGGGTITATAGLGVASLTGASLAGSASCTFSMNVTGTTAGTKINTTSTVSSVEGGTGGTTSASVTVGAAAPPTIVKSFGVTSIPLNGSTSLGFTINNPNASTALTGVGFTDTLPAGLVVSTPNGLTGSCGGGTITATAGLGVVSLTGASLAATASCTFSVNVTGNSLGTKTNTTSTVTSVEGGTGGAASANVTVVAIATGPASIPTLQPWALGLLGLLLVVTASVVLRAHKIV